MHTITSRQTRGAFFTVLLVEDSDDDVLLYRRAMQKNKFENPLHRVKNGGEAIAYLRGEGKYADRKKFAYPGLIITDLKMPETSGLEMLQWIKSNAKYKVIPTIMISTSDEENDIRDAYQAGADAYMVKPRQTGQLVRKLESIFNYWAECELPSRILNAVGG